ATWRFRHSGLVFGFAYLDRVGHSGPGLSPGPGRRAVVTAVTAEDLRPVLVPCRHGAVGVQDDGPAVAVDLHLVMVGAEQHAVVAGGLAAVGFVGQVVDFAAGGGLVAAGGELAVLVPLDDRPADRGGDAGGDADVEREAAAGQPGAELLTAQEGRQPAGAGQQ